jgi:catechol 2,3-dioxygenase-like lactoylglutathione lyase family enzyme
MVRTYGLTHINLAVRDARQSLQFYRQVFGVEEYGRGGGLVHAKTPGCRDVITFDEHAPGAGESRGIVHFGFRLVSPGDIDGRSRTRWREAATAWRVQPWLPIRVRGRPGWLRSRNLV